MKTICKHGYPADLCGTCNPIAKVKANRPSGAASGSAFLRDQIANLRSAGWIAHAKEFETAIIALQVISTWATFDGGSALVPEHVAKMCAKALRPFGNPASKTKKQNDEVARTEGEKRS